MNLFFKKLFGYKFITYEFKGDVFCETTTYSAITVRIDNQKMPDPERYFSDSVTLWDRTPVSETFSKELPKRMFKNHIYLSS